MVGVIWSLGKEDGIMVILALPPQMGCEGREGLVIVKSACVMLTAGAQKCFE